MPQHEVVLIAKDARITQLLQATYMLEDSEVIAHCAKMTINIEPPQTLENVLNILRTELSTKENPIVALFCPGRVDGAWYDTSVRVISDGKNRTTTDTLLIGMNYVAQKEETDVTDQRGSTQQGK